VFPESCCGLLEGGWGVLKRQRLRNAQAHIRKRSSMHRLSSKVFSPGFTFHAFSLSALLRLGSPAFSGAGEPRS